MKRMVWYPQWLSFITRDSSLDSICRSGRTHHTSPKQHGANSFPFIYQLEHGAEKLRGGSTSSLPFFPWPMTTYGVVIGNGVAFTHADGSALLNAWTRK